ncbi:MAG TPA: 23S ribosomal RNA methyltransferase Erm [Beutenbergiaceae bacterium]|nr:23S ribosomal RNA methyltransferase Erm [Beutenbergiaceae bacterium]
MPTYRGGRHEHGQNFLTDHTTIARLSRLVADSPDPIVEIGPGQGRLTRELQQLGRPLTAVELDSRLANRLASASQFRDRKHLSIVNADFMHWPLPRTSYVVVGNVPFHLTTAILRKLLHDGAWTQVVLLVQWEVARRRAGIGGSSMMTAQWWPWIDFSLHGRVPRSAFKPAPSVDGGILMMTRRPKPLLDLDMRRSYRQFVHEVFTGRGRGIGEILANVSGALGRRGAHQLVSREGILPSALPKDLSANQWARLFISTSPTTGARAAKNARPTDSRRRKGR